MTRQPPKGSSIPTLFEVQESTSPAAVQVKPLNRCIWSVHKAQLIQHYLEHFVFVTKCGTYIDGFAGPQNPNEPECWSAKRVLESQVRPKRMRNFYLFDASPDQISRIKAMESGLPCLPDRQQRSVEVILGDFNETVHELLQTGRLKPEPTFCLLDQRTFECRWSTVEAIAGYKRGNTKIEMFYFLPNGWLDRAFSASSREETLAVIEAWWGRSDWECLTQMNGRKRAEIFTRRFLELGYADVKPWPIYSSSGSTRVMYYMVHATDHREAPILMRRAYEKVGLGSPQPDSQLQLAFGDISEILQPPDPPTPDFPEDLFGLDLPDRQEPISTFTR